jgi:hypothetical protein
MLPPGQFPGWRRLSTHRQASTRHLLHRIDELLRGGDAGHRMAWRSLAGEKARHLVGHDDARLRLALADERDLRERETWEQQRSETQR